MATRRSSGQAGRPLAPRIPTRRLRVVARDPAMQIGGRMLTADVEIVNEELGPGPRGHRVHVIDYDSTTQTFYRPIRPSAYGTLESPRDPFEKAPDAELLRSPAFHAQNVYAIVLRTLSQFENALGRRMAWNAGGFGGSQIAAVPHAFADANAFYSDRDGSLVFGYFPARRHKGMVFSCLSHDVIVHETAHALLDGMRPGYSRSSNPDMAAFHEGFADLVAILSVFSLPAVVSAGLDYRSPKRHEGLVARSALTLNRLGAGSLFRLAEEMGTELTGVLGDGLRRSLQLMPSTRHLTQPEFQLPHRRGEVLVAAMLQGFLRVWVGRLQSIASFRGRAVLRNQVVAEGAEAAARLLGMAVRAIDYSPPLDLQFPDFLSALLTADAEASPDDSRYQYREELRRSFADYGIRPAASRKDGLWHGALEGILLPTSTPEREDVSRLLYDNWRALGLARDVPTHVQYVRPSLVPAGPERFNVLRELTAEYVQVLRVRARHLHRYGIRRPAGLRTDAEVTLHGGGTLVFSQNGTLKYHVQSALLSPERQSRVLAYSNEYGFDERRAGLERYAAMHRLKQLDVPYAALDEF